MKTDYYQKIIDTFDAQKKLATLASWRENPDIITNFQLATQLLAKTFGTSQSHLKEPRIIFLYSKNWPLKISYRLGGHLN